MLIEQDLHFHKEIRLWKLKRFSDMFRSARHFTGTFEAEFVCFWPLSDLQQYALKRNFVLDVSPEASASSILLYSLISGSSSGKAKVFR